MGSGEQSAKDELEPVPLLDFSPFFEQQNQHGRQRVCDALIASLQRYGIARLSHHGVPATSIENAFGKSRQFFALSEESKKYAAHPNGPNPHRGYCHVGLEKTYGITGFERGVADAPRIEDVKESFDVGAVDNKRFSNRWPEPTSVPEFQSSMESFFDECHTALCNIMDAVAQGLYLNPRSLSEQHSSKDHELRLLHYPAVPAESLDGTRLRIAEHTDFGSITLLFQDAVGGLEVESQHYKRHGEPESTTELPFRAIDDSQPIMIVNIGDSLERWTNSHLRAIVHRVSRSRTARTEQNYILPDRYSIAFFGKPNGDVSLRPLPQFVTEHKPALWPHTTAYEHNQSKLTRTFEVPSGHPIATG